MPIGKHRLTVAPHGAAITLTDFNGDLRTASVMTNETDVSYVSRSRAVATLDSKISAIEVDGAPFWKSGTGVEPASFLLPAGQHVVTFYR